MQASPSSHSPPHDPSLALVRDQVRQLLSSSAAFRALSPEDQRRIAHNTVNVAHYLASPEGLPGNTLPTAQNASRDPYALQMAGAAPLQPPGSPQFQAQGAREGARVAGLLLQQVNFPNFCASLIQGVFHAIVQASIEQMHAYGELVANVAKTLDQFRDENVTENQAKDHLVNQFPDLFKIDIDTGDDGSQQPRVRLQEGADEQVALDRVKSLPVDGAPITSLDDDTVQGRLVPAARTQLATSRQQLLATMVLMGINRIVVTDGKIQAKVMYDFHARDKFHQKFAATQFDYGNQYRFSSSSTSETQPVGGDGSGGSDGTQRDASYYTKGTYQTQAEPVLNLMSATQATTDAELTTKATLSGLVDINFKSDYLPLEKMADSFQIGRIQDAAKPGQARAAPPTPPAAGAPANAPAPAVTPPTAQPSTPLPRP